MKIAVAGMGYGFVERGLCWRSAMRSSRWTSTRTGSTRSTPAGPRIEDPDIEGVLGWRSLNLRATADPQDAYWRSFCDRRHSLTDYDPVANFSTPVRWRRSSTRSAGSSQTPRP